MNPCTREFTWNSADCSVSCHLDRFYISGNILNKCNSCCITHFPYSDHDALQMSFQTPDSLDRGPGVWKFNTTLLENKDYISKVASFWKHWQKRKSDFSNLNVWWDIGKKKLKHISIRFSKSTCSKKTTPPSKLRVATQRTNC